MTHKVAGAKMIYQLNCRNYLTKTAPAVILLLIFGFSNPAFTQTTETSTPTKIEFQIFAPKNCHLRILRTRLRIVQSESDWQELLADSVCKDAPKLNINLAKSTLIGAGFFVGGCATGNLYAVEIWCEASEKVYRVKIRIPKKNSCRSSEYREVWMLLPKLSEDYKIVAERVLDLETSSN